MKKFFYMMTAVALAGAVMLAGCGNKEPEAPPLSAPSGPVEEIKISNDKEVASEYDCIVMDGSPEGIAAAISAARNGLDTLLLCQDASLGGLYTLGELNFIDIPESREGELLVNGIYQEFSDAVGGSGFDITQAKNTFYEMVKAEKNLTLRVNARFSKPVMDGNTVTGVEVVEDGKKVTYTAPTVIDATQDGDVCAAAGAPYTFAGEDIGERDRVMGVTLVFRLSGVDWDKVTEHVTTVAEGESSAEGGISGNLAWGYGKEGYAYEPVDPNLRTRGYNIARQANGDVLINSLIIFDVDALDEESRQEGIERGKAELPHIVAYMRETCPGFENAELAGTAEQLYVRETRHIECESMLTIDDVMENRWQEDAIAVSNYPVDVQATKTMRFGVVVGFPDQYAISYGSIVPKKIDGLLIVGRSAGYRSLAAGSARIVPTGMACAQAAGVAAKVAQDRDESLRDLCKDEKGIKKMQKLLTKQGANLEHQQTPGPASDHWAYDGLKVMRSLGIARGGYDNNYGMDEPINAPSYANMMNSVVKKTGLDLNPSMSLEKGATNQAMLTALAAQLAGLEGEAAPADGPASVAYLKDKGVLDERLEKEFADPAGIATGGSMYMLGARYYEHLLTLPGAVTLIGVDPLEK